MIVRNSYIQQLESFINKPFIKIITGIRRSGKSSVLLLLRDKLLEKGVSAEQIIFMNFESFAYSDLQQAENLYKYIASKIQPAKKNYLLLDEIQEVENWEKCINSFSVDFDVDIYLTGSNSHLLSSELSTYLAGRYVEISVFTLSFKEYLQFQANYAPQITTNNKESFVRYLRMGGFPAIHTTENTEETTYKIVYDIYSSIILRDTIQRYNIRDVELLERVVRYAFDNIGNTFSGKNVADYFKSQQRKIDLNTVYNYLNALESAFIFHRVSRYDIKGKEILKTQEKFYLSDLSLLYASMGYKDRLIAGILENIVFLELKRRGYTVYIGKIDTKEIDFIAEKQGEKIYVQVAYKLDNPQTIEREFSVLLTVKDQFPKFLVTMDDFWRESIEGVQHFYISDFLLSDSF
ncbi:MAG: ATP-binding protein [Bacteroidales bacterium]|jgi:predicted AAA+ superfamily ATPase|nr:ATP-binding protein [Bacteroidales bacterium]